jgi:hypothetical protein
MIKLQTVPDGIDRIVGYYGSPGYVENGKFIQDKEWVGENVGWFGLSFPLRQSWDLREIRGFWINKKVGPAMIDALDEIKDTFGLSFMRRNGLDLWGGCHNPRLKRGDYDPSTHAWAIAIDYCPDLGKLGNPSNMPWVIVDAFTKRRFDWGGLWDFRDGMHFQACTGY